MTPTTSSGLGDPHLFWRLVHHPCSETAPPPSQPGREPTGQRTSCGALTLSILSENYQDLYAIEEDDIYNKRLMWTGEKWVDETTGKEVKLAERQTTQQLLLTQVCIPETRLSESCITPPGHSRFCSRWLRCCPPFFFPFSFPSFLSDLRTCFCTSRASPYAIEEQDTWQSRLKADRHVACAAVQVLAQSKPSAVAKGGAAKNYDCCYLAGKEGGHQALVTRGKHSVDSGFYCHMPQQVSARVCGFMHCGRMAWLSRWRERENVIVRGE